MRGIAFKVTYNDGGADPGGLIGYRGVCSNRVILENVKVRQMSNCSNTNGPCRMFADANFRGARPTLEGREPWCYEATLLSRRPWQFGGGVYQKGEKTGRAIPMKAVVGDIALLTTIAPGAAEEDRFIFAAFRVGDVREMDRWGIVATSDGNMEVRVPDKAAQQIRFWNFYKNADRCIFWGTGLHRYLDNEATVAALAEMMGALGNLDERDLIFEALGRNVFPRLPLHGGGAGGYGTGGEGESHRRLKERVAANPSLIGLPPTANADIEHLYTSGDRADILFDLSNGRAAVVEIETIVTLPGAHQCVKYRALQEAERDEPINSGAVDAVLVAYTFDEETREFASRYNIRLVQLRP